MKATIKYMLSEVFRIILSVIFIIVFWLMLPFTEKASCRRCGFGYSLSPHGDGVICKKTNYLISDRDMDKTAAKCGYYRRVKGVEDVKRKSGKGMD